MSYGIAFVALSLARPTWVIAMAVQHGGIQFPRHHKYKKVRLIPYSNPARDSQLQLSALAMRFSILGASALIAEAIAAPANSAIDKRHVIHEKRDSLPVNWRRSAKLHPDSILPMRIALTQGNLDKADEFLMDVSHPTSPNFGKHWTAKQVAEMFAPTKETIDAVTGWLAEAGIIKVTQSQSLNWINANVPVAKAERLLQTSYFEYIHESGKSHVACEEYSVPEHLRDHIDFITPTVHFDAKANQPTKRSTDLKPAVQPAKAKSIGSATSNVASPKTDSEIPLGEIIAELKQCDTYITPDCLRALYLLPPNFPEHPGSESSLVIVPILVAAPPPIILTLPVALPLLAAFWEHITNLDRLIRNCGVYPAVIFAKRFEHIFRQLLSSSSWKVANFQLNRWRHPSNNQ
jgi:hypothetical protein